jgi:hypothetical protein
MPECQKNVNPASAFGLKGGVGRGYLWRTESANFYCTVENKRILYVDKGDNPGLIKPVVHKCSENKEL